MMPEIVSKIVTSIVFSCLFFVATFKTLGIMQQCGYKNKAFVTWLKRKDNMYFNRLSIWSIFAFLFSALCALCLSPLGGFAALVAAIVAMMIVSFTYCVLDSRYALKVPVNVTGRIRRLSVFYVFVVACVSYIVLSVLRFLTQVIGNDLCSVLLISVFSFTPFLLPFLLCIANGIASVFENYKNKKFVENAGQVLKNSRAIHIGVVGSYGKTSVKNILNAVLSEKYSVIATPESYNTPVGVAKTVNCLNVEECDVFIAEMGARREGDIAELCALVEPDYAFFTGVCAQHMATFETEEKLLKAKCEIVKGVKNVVVCGESLKTKISSVAFLTAEEKRKCEYVDGACIKDLVLEKNCTRFTLELAGLTPIHVETAMLGKCAAENIALAAALAVKLGLTAEAIERGLKNVKPVPHRLQLIESGGVSILDDAYNCNERSAREALQALNRFEGRKILVTPGIVEAGILEEKINSELGKAIAEYACDLVILVGETLITPVKNGYLSVGGQAEKLLVVPSLELAKKKLAEYVQEGDAVLFLNDLPDVY